MTTRGTVRVWHDAEGWGVVDSVEAPGGCWAGFGVVLVPGHAVLHAGRQVEPDHEAGWQDGCAYRAVRVWPAGEQPVERPADPPPGPYTSTLTLDDD